MPHEQSSAKKKRIILSTHRKNAPHPPPSSKLPADSNVTELKEFKEDGGDQSMMINCASINNSLEIFDQDPKNRHLQFLDHEEERHDTLQSKEKSRVNYLQTMPSTANMHKKNKNQHTLSKIDGVISLSSLHSNQFACGRKLATSPSRKFIDLTIKTKRLSHQCSASFLPATEGSDKSCMNRSSLFETERSILSSVSVNSVQFAVARAPSSRKKALTITCHKYEEEPKGKKQKTENMSKCNSIKLFGKFI